MADIFNTLRVTMNWQSEFMVIQSVILKDSIKNNFKTFNNDIESIFDVIYINN